MRRVFLGSLLASCLFALSARSLYLKCFFCPFLPILLCTANRFYHSKGFLCNGNEFVGDWEATPTFVSGDRIGVRLDLTRGVMVFSCNGKQVPGALQGIGGKVEEKESLQTIPTPTSCRMLVCDRLCSLSLPQCFLVLATCLNRSHGLY